jgi:hypothetical protein
MPVQEGLFAGHLRVSAQFRLFSGKPTIITVAPPVTLDMGMRTPRRSPTILASPLVSCFTSIVDVSIALSSSCSNQGQTATPTGVDPVPTPSGTISYTGGAISVESFSSGSYSTPASTGTTSHVSGYTTARTNGTSTGTASTTATSIAANPSSFSGGAGKGKSSGVSGLVCLTLFASALMAFGAWA